MELTREDVFSVANAATATGLALSVGGAVNIDELAGVLAFGAGRVCDVADGYLARRYHASEFGAKFDATADKIAVLFGCYFAYAEEVAPTPVIATIVGVNILNAAANVYLEAVGAHPVTDEDGRRQMAAFMACLGSFALGNATDTEAFNTVGIAAFGAGVIPAVSSSARYQKHAWNERQQRRAPKQNIRPTPVMRPSKRRA